MSKEITLSKSEEEKRVIPYERKEISNAKIFGGSGENFQHSHLVDVNGKNEFFENIDFSYAIITRGYFHKSKFKNCKFIGARFVDGNFRNAEFVNCEFKYSDFNNTRIETDEMLRNLPDEPNIRRELLQVLRKNSISVGDVRSARAFVLSEIDAKKEHLRRAWRLEGSYYREKYSGFWKQAKIGFNRFALALDSFLWGHGERLWKMVISVGVLIAFSSCIASINWLSLQSNPSVSDLGSFVIDAMVYYTSLFLDVNVGYFAYRVLWLDWVIAVARYIAFGVMVTGLFRWLSHR